MSEKIVEPKPSTTVLWIDFLRGIAALGVVFHHLLSTTWSGFFLATRSSNVIDQLCAYLSLPSYYGGSTVILFFIISGFCIHYPYAGKQHLKKWDLRTYSLRRFLRIYPPYFACTIAALSIVALTGSSNCRFDPAQLAETIFMVQNYHLGNIEADPVLWSLPVEAEFYIMYPLLLTCWSNYGSKKTTLAVAVISLAATISGIAGWAYASLNFAQYWLIWFSGALLAERIRNKSDLALRNIHVVLMVAAGLTAALLHLRFAAGEIWSCGLFYFLVVCLGIKSPKITKWLQSGSARPFLSLGKISFSLYLIHYPVLFACGTGFCFLSGAKPTNYLLCCLFSIPVCIGAAALFYSLVEKPAHSLARKIAGTKFDPSTPIT